MHILIVSHYALPHQGGVELVVEQLWHRLSEQGHKVTHLCSSIDAPLDEQSNQQSDKRVRVRIPALNFLENSGIPYPLFQPFTLWSKLNDLLKTVDMVNVQGMLYMDCVIAATMARQRSIPVVVTEYAGFMNYKRAFVNFVERTALHTIGRLCVSRASAAVVINDKVAHDWIRPFVQPGVPIQKIDVGVDIDRFKPAPPDEKQRLRQKWNLTRPTALFVGRLIYRKGIDLLDNLVTEPYDLIICGRGTFASDKPNIRVLGEVSTADLLELYLATDIFILLTDGPDFPLVGLEAISNGLPIMAFDTPANHEYLDKCCTVFTDRSTLQKDIAALLGDDLRCAQMGQAARQWAVDHYSWQQVAEKYLRVFQDLT